MKRYFICLECIERSTGKSAYDLPVEQFNEIRAKLAFESETAVCTCCGSKNLKPVLGLETSYVRGYGFADKKGVKRDMDIHAMTTDRDPYKEHRQLGESREVVTKLQRDREHHKKPKTIGMG